MTPTDKQLDFIQWAAGYHDLSTREIADAFTQRFRKRVSAHWIAAILRMHVRYALKNGREKRAQPPYTLTWAQHRFLVKAYANTAASPVKAATEALNARFGLDLPWLKVKRYLDDRNKSARKHGKPAPFVAGNNCQFVAGKEVNNNFHKHKPVGAVSTVRYSNSGKPFLAVKLPGKNPWTGMESNWRRLAVVKWEEYHGRPCPKEHAVLQLNGDYEDVSKENLVLVTRAELGVLNKTGFPDLPPDRDLRTMALNAVRLKVKANRISPSSWSLYKKAKEAEDEEQKQALYAAARAAKREERGLTT